MRPIFLLVFCCLLGVLNFSSCSNSSLSPELLDVESYIQDRPDSALSVLEAMNPQEYKSQKNRSLHALLHAMALDKNFIDVADDSLANVALEYFEHWGPKKYKARSLYYRGLSYFYARQIDDAIIDLSRAEKICEESNDTLYLAMTYVCQADTYSLVYNDVQEIVYLNKALELFKMINKTYYIDVVNRRLAAAYMNAREYDKSENLLNSLLQKDSLDVNVKVLSMLSYAYLNMIKPDRDPQVANVYYGRVYEMGYSHMMDLRNYWAWAASMNMVGSKKESQSLVEQLIPISDDFLRDYWLYEISKSDGDIKSALELYEASAVSGNDEVEKSLRQSVAIYQRDYYHTQAALEALKVKSRTNVFCFIVLISFLIILLISYIVRKRVQAIKKENEEKVNFVERLVEQLTCEQNEKTELRKKYLSLHQAKYDILRKLCEQYYTLENRVDVEKLMLKNVSSLIDSIRCNEKTQVQFEKMLNKERDDIVKHLRTEMPKLKKIDYALFCYYIVGFDAMTISRFLGVSESNIYAHKRRLRIKIEKAHPEHHDLFMEVF